MPPRLAYRKARTGCRRCKQRKVKCTEERPTCAACERHGVSCEYGDHGPARSAQPLKASPARSSEHDLTTISPPSGLNPPYPHDLDGLLPVSLRHRVELYLIHRFKSSVSCAFPSAQRPHLKELYNLHVTEAAFDHQYLLNAIFAITSLYLWMCEVHHFPESVAGHLPVAFRDVDFSHLHRAYLNLSISEQRDELSCLGPSNADALGLTSILLSIMSTCLLPDVSTSDEDRYVPPIQWLTLSSAVKTVFQAAIPFLQSGAIIEFLRASREPNLRDQDIILDPNNTAAFTRILEFEDADDPLTHQAQTDPTIQEAYRNALAIIGSIHNAVRAGEPANYVCTRVIAFGPMVPKPFIDLLAQQRPRAMAILAQYMVFVRYNDGYWWFKGRAEREILGIRRSLPQKWQWALRWPLAALSNPEYVKLDPMTLYGDMSVG